MVLYFLSINPEIQEKAREEAISVLGDKRYPSYEDQKEMRAELMEWVKTCDKFHMGELYSEMKRMKRSWEDK